MALLDMPPKIFPVSSLSLSWRPNEINSAVSNWSRFFRAGICAAFTLLLGATPRSVGAADGDDTLWLARTWQTEEGLPDNSITGVAQSADGYLWVATLGG